MKAEKVITLVALVITIIVLIILAMVSISIVYNQGLIKNSQDAVQTHKNEAANEQTTINTAADNVQGWINAVHPASK